MKNKSNLLVRIFLAWLPFAILSTLICGLTYISVQQVLRLSANDPQIQMAEDTASLLNQDKKFSLPTEQVDIEKSLAPFTILFNQEGKVSTSTGKINGEIPNLPSGVLDYVKSHSEERVTWQAKDDVRIAAVVVPIRKNDQVAGFVLVGRSLREVEKREDKVFLYTITAWLSSLILILIAILVKKSLLR